MREIDPQSEARLTEALRRLAVASPRSAPAAMEAALLGKFRRHHARRRLVRRGGMLALAACVVLAAIWSSRSNWQHGPSQGNVSRAAAESHGQPSVAAPVAVVPKQVENTSAKRRSIKPAIRSVNRAFLALPAYDPSVPLDDLQVVRVQLPASALWKIGAPMPPDAGERRMTADFVVGQDGTAYAARLVQ